MTNHESLAMHREKVRISDKDMLKEILGRCEVFNLGLHDEPYPYTVAMNYGFEWDDKLIFYGHMAIEGHRIELIRKNPLVSVSVFEFLDRCGYRPYRNETHDYRSVHAYGKASIITPEQREEYLHGFSLLHKNCARPPIKEITDEMRRRLFVLKIECDFVTGKAQYPISTVSEVEIPENTK